MPVYGSPGTDAGFRSAVRFLAERLPAARPAAAESSPLEAMPSSADKPRTVGADVIEGTTLRARRITGEPEVGFTAFLDGTQESRVVRYVDGGVPIVHGTAAAVVRVRTNRRMCTWRQEMRQALYAPRRLLSARVWDSLGGFPLIDTSRALPDETPAARHPFLVLEAAVHAVQWTRETAEQYLAEQWCGVQKSPLFIDGGIGGSERVATASCTVGVVKSHRTLYAVGDSLDVVLGLRWGERTSVFRIRSEVRTPVASFYLRVRDAAGRDPLWGLVRVEIAQGPDASERADRVARWILAEQTPLALPDGRWDRMVYGVRDCEEYLRAIS